MPVYEFATYTWTLVAAGGAVAALGALLGRETVRAIECLRHQRERDTLPISEPSWPSSPTPSAPSCPGI